MLEYEMKVTKDYTYLDGSKGVMRYEGILRVDGQRIRVVADTRWGLRLAAKRAIRKSRQAKQTWKVKVWA